MIAANLTATEVLGITTGATKIEIKKAYHKVSTPILHKNPEKA